MGASALSSPVWEWYLRPYPDREHVDWILTGIREGIEIGYEGDENLPQVDKNLPLLQGNRVGVRNNREMKK